MVPCIVLALLLLLSLAVPVRAGRLVVSLAAHVFVVGGVAAVIYLPNSAWVAVMVTVKCRSR